MGGALLSLDEMLALMRERLGNHAVPTKSTAETWQRPSCYHMPPPGWPRPRRVPGRRRKLYSRADAERYIERTAALAGAAQPT